MNEVYILSWPTINARHKHYTITSREEGNVLKAWAITQVNERRIMASIFPYPEMRCSFHEADLLLTQAMYDRKLRSDEVIACFM